MAKKEVYPNPTVKQVIFQIKYPNLFYIESKIPEIQLKIIDKFPESELRYSSFFSFGEIGPNKDIEKIEKRIREGESGKKIWTFRSPLNYELNILSNSLDITSKYHKTYENFREIIAFVLDSFFKSISVPIIQRIGIRYTDECPIVSMDNKTFTDYYNSVIPAKRFPIDKMKEAIFRATCERDEYYLTYMESLQEKEERHVLILDFDGYAMTVKPEDCMKVTDKLHNIISNEYFNTIREPVKEYMRKEDKKKKCSGEEKKKKII